MTLEVAAAVSEEDTLAQCLAASPEIASGRYSLSTYRGYASAASALNAALRAATADWVVLAHQDVYFPPGSLKRLEKSLDALSEASPSTAVCGAIGRTRAGETVGEVWSSGMGKLVGVPVDQPVEVDTIDEVVICVRRGTVVFDESLPGFHLYGTDIVLGAQQRGLTALVVPSTLIHHSKPVIDLSGDYARAYRHLRRKWASRLPLLTMMGDVRALPGHAMYLDLRVRRAAGFARTRKHPEGSPQEISRAIGYED